MHLIENYALTDGVKISQPQISTLFYPIEFENYITIHASSGMVSKNFDYYNDVIRLIKPYLNEHNIGVVQIGQEKEPEISNCTNLLGQTNIRQCAHVIRNSKLHLGNDSFACHMAGHFNVPLVALYGRAPSSTCYPYWGKKSQQILLEPTTKDKPSYCAKERVKRINSISTFKIAASVLDLLSIKHDLHNYNQLYIGENYNSHTIDIVPNFKPNRNPELNAVKLINIRTDYDEDISEFNYWASSKLYNLYINKEIDIKLIQSTSNKLQEIFVYIDNNFTTEYIQELFKLNKKIIFLAKNNENLPELRIKFFDLDIIPLDNKKNYLDICDDICDNYFQSSLKLYSNSKVYSCKAYLDINQTLQRKEKALDCDSFYEELIFFKLYKLCQQPNQK